MGMWGVARRLAAFEAPLGLPELGLSSVRRLQAHNTDIGIALMYKMSGTDAQCTGMTLSFVHSQVHLLRIPLMMMYLITHQFQSTTEQIA